MRIYLDACCLNRPFDDQSQERVRLESEAIQSIHRRVVAGELVLISSSLLVHEVMKGQDEKRHIGVLRMLSMAGTTVQITESHEARAKELIRGLGLANYDALHVALAVSAGVHAFLTVDDLIVKRAAEPLKKEIRIANPLDWAIQNL